jgi:HTH-type transcriptional regulator / antitoxin HigA
MTMPMLERGYVRLLSKTPPVALHNKEEHAFYLRQIEALMLKGDDRTPAEERLLETLVELAHVYEQKHHPARKLEPANVLAYLMEENNLKPSDLPIPASRVSEILKGKRAISKSQALLLAERFKVSPALFIG